MVGVVLVVVSYLFYIDSALEKALPGLRRKAFVNQFEDVCFHSNRQVISMEPASCKRNE